MLTLKTRVWVEKSSPDFDTTGLSNELSAIASIREFSKDFSSSLLIVLFKRKQKEKVIINDKVVVVSKGVT